MCGLFGYISATTITNADINSLCIGTAVSTLRGKDSTGIVCLYRDRPLYWETEKTLQNGFEWASESGKRGLRGILAKGTGMSAVLGHTRASTVGASTIANAHPHVEGDIILTHNGTLRNFRTGFLSKGVEPTVEVDSCYIAAGLNATNPDVKSIVAFLETIQGAYALVWYDTRSGNIHMARNEERTLYLHQLDDGLCYASTEEAIAIALGDKFNPKKAKPLSIGRLVSIHHADNTSTVRKFTPKETISYGVTIVRGNSGYYQYDRGTNVRGTVASLPKPETINSTKLVASDIIAYPFVASDNQESDVFKVKASYNTFRFNKYLVMCDVGDEIYIDPEYSDKDVIIAVEYTKLPKSGEIIECIISDDVEVEVSYTNKVYIFAKQVEVKKQEEKDEPDYCIVCNGLHPLPWDSDTYVGGVCDGCKKVYFTQYSHRQGTYISDSFGAISKRSSTVTPTTDSTKQHAHAVN